MTVFFYFATAMAAGIAFTLPLVPIEQIGRRFHVLMSLLAVAFSVLALVASGLGINYFHAALAGLLITYNIALPPHGGVDISSRREALEGGPSPKLAAACRILLGAAAIAGAAGLVSDAMDVRSAAGESIAGAPWLVGSFLSSALVLGSSATAMVLGHWYLVARKLPFGLLGRLTAVLAAALVLRAAAAGWALCAQWERWDAMVSRSGPEGFFLAYGVFLAARVIFGFAAPLAFAWMTWRCVRIRSNQSATGILYVNLAFVLIGEIIAKHFVVSEGLTI